jgi:hypothetical protein
LRVLRTLPTKVSCKDFGHSNPAKPPIIPSKKPTIKPPPIGMLRTEQTIIKRLRITAFLGCRYRRMPHNRLITAKISQTASNPLPIYAGMPKLTRPQKEGLSNWLTEDTGYDWMTTAEPFEAIHKPLKIIKIAPIIEKTKAIEDSF